MPRWIFQVSIPSNQALFTGWPFHFGISMIDENLAAKIVRPFIKRLAKPSISTAYKAIPSFRRSKAWTRYLTDFRKTHASFGPPRHDYPPGVDIHTYGFPPSETHLPA